MTDQIKAVELYRKLPKEMRHQISYLKPEATLEELLTALRGVRYWANCSGDKTGLFDPMDLDVHAQEDPEEAFGFRRGEGRGFRVGDGRAHRPVLSGDTINFKNVDGPRSLMTA